MVLLFSYVHTLPSATGLEEGYELGYGSSCPPASLFSTLHRVLRYSVVGAGAQEPTVNRQKPGQCLPCQTVLLGSTSQVIHGHPLDICGRLDVIGIRD